MRCSAYCTANSYNLNAIADYFRMDGYNVKFYRTVLYIHHPKSQAEIFFFNLGCLVSWGLTNRGEKKLLSTIKLFERDPLPVPEKDYFVYHYGDETSITTHDRFNVDIITLESDDVSIMLALSYGIAHSVKLQIYEESVIKTINKYTPIPKALAINGRISLSKKAIAKSMGEIFLERSYVNLSSEYLDMPEYFWRYPRVEIYYIQVEKFLDIKSRVSSLNQRLNILQELFDVLSAQLQHSHTTMLEIIIVLLILIEVVLGLLPFFHK
jgi:uncharacterized Rmd1/YagE family protein